MNESPSLYDLISAKLRTHPELIEVARQNCAAWLRDGVVTPQRLHEWDAVLAAAQRSETGLARLLEILAARTAEDERLREFHPFAGILSREERRQARELCGYRH